MSFGNNLFSKDIFTDSMRQTPFNPEYQENNLPSKIVTGLERISEAFKVLLWEKAKVLGLSPIQIQILIFVAYHKEAYCNVSHLAKEFNVTKPTISDAIRVLINKELISKTVSVTDSRSYAIILTTQGQDIVTKTENFAKPIQNQLDVEIHHDLEQLFGIISKVIYRLNKIGVLSVQRTCYACKFYSKQNQSHYCNLIQFELHENAIRLDCPEFQDK